MAATTHRTRLLIIGGWILALGGLLFVTPCAVAVIAFQAGHHWLHGLLVARTTSLRGEIH